MILCFASAVPGWKKGNEKGKVEKDSAKGGKKGGKGKRNDEDDEDKGEEDSVDEEVGGNGHRQMPETKNLEQWRGQTEKEKPLKRPQN